MQDTHQWPVALPWPLAASLVLTLLALTSLHSPIPAQAAVGQQVPDHEFDPLLGHDGRTKLADLRGHPVLIAGFKQHLVNGIDAARIAHVLLEKHSKAGLIVILEQQKAWRRDYDRARIQMFWLRNFGTPAWLASNTGGEDQDLPIERKKSKRNDASLVLIGVDGRLVLEDSAPKGSANKKSGIAATFGRAVAAELRKRKQGWGDDPISRKVRAAAFGKGNLAAARKALQSAKDMPKEKQQALDAELLAAFAVRAKQIRFFAQQGRFLDAKKELAALGASARGLEAHTEALGELSEMLRTTEARAGLKLDRKLARLLKPFGNRQFAKFGIDGILAVQAFAKKHAGNPVGARAARMDILLKHVVAAENGLSPKELEPRIEKKRK